MMTALADFKSVLRPGGKIIIQNRNFDSILKTHNRWMEPETYRRMSILGSFMVYDFDPDGRITFHIVILHDQNQGIFQQNVVSTRLYLFLTCSWSIGLKKRVLTRLNFLVIFRVMF